MNNLCELLTRLFFAAYFAHMTTEPGKAFTRLAVSMSEEDDRRLMKLRAHLEAKTGQRHSMAEVVRKAVACLCESEGVL